MFTCWGYFSRPQKEVQYNPEVTRTLKENEKQFELVGNSSYQGKFQGSFDQEKENLVRVSGKFELSQFELQRFYCPVTLD